MWSLADKYNVWVDVEDELDESAQGLGDLVGGGSIFGIYGVGCAGLTTWVA